MINKSDEKTKNKNLKYLKPPPLSLCGIKSMSISFNCTGAQQRGGLGAPAPKIFLKSP